MLATSKHEKPVNTLTLLVSKSFRFFLCFGLSMELLLPITLGQSSGLLKKLDGSSDQYANTIECLVEFIPGRIKNGEEVKLKFWGRVSEGYHIYSISPQGQFAPDPTQIIIDSLYLKVASELVESDTILVKDEAFDAQLKVHKNDFWLERKYRLQNFLTPGSYKLEGSLFYQICNNKICSLPVTKKFFVPLEVSEN